MAKSQKSEYTTDAFKGELDFIWKDTQFAGEVPEMAQFRGLAASIKKSYVNAGRSRRMLFHYMTEFKSGSDKDLINLMYKQLPVSNYIGKFLSNVATAYKWSPERTFGKDGQQNDTFIEIYKQARVNRAFRRVHRLARLLNIVALRPVVRRNKLEPGMEVLQTVQGR